MTSLIGVAPIRCQMDQDYQKAVHLTSEPSAEGSIALMVGLGSDNVRSWRGRRTYSFVMLEIGHGPKLGYPSLGFYEDFRVRRAR